MIDDTQHAETNPSGRLRQFWHVHRPMLLDVAVTFAVSRLIFYTVIIIATLTIPEHPGEGYTPYNVSDNPLVDGSFRWDSGWYREIAEEGYAWASEGEHSVAFFPVYPLLLRAIFAITPESLEIPTAILVNHVIFFIALIPVWLYACRFGGRAIAQRTLFFLAIFPTAFFFNALYTEALFLLLTAWGLLAIASSRYLTAGAVGFFASLTRTAGVLLAVPFAVHILIEHRRNGIVGMVRANWPLLFVPAGLGVYTLYLWARFGEPLAFVKVQEAWGHVQMLPTTAIYQSLHYLLFTTDRDIYFVMGIVNTGLTIGALILTAALVRSDKLGASFAFAAIMMPLVAGIEGMPVVSMGRYVLVLFPLLIPLARWAENWAINSLVTALFLPTHILLAALFVRWYWVV